MLPIVDSNWSPASQDAASDCHIMRAVAVQAAMANAKVDSGLAALSLHAKTPGLGGLPNGIAAYLDITAADALARIEEFRVSDSVLGVNIVFVSESDSEIHAGLYAPCIDVLASNQASVDISGDVDSIKRFLKMVAHVPKLNIVCNISLCSRAGSLLSVVEWPELTSELAAHENVAVKITDPPAAEFLSATDQLARAIQQLAGSIGFARILFGSSATRIELPDDRNVWQYFDAATRRVSARQRDQLFRENCVRIYRI